LKLESARPMVMASGWIRKLALACVTGASIVAALIALRLYRRARPVSSGMVKREEEDGAAAADAYEAQPAAQKAKRSEEASASEPAGTFPLSELPRDALVASLELLGATDLSKLAGVSRLFFLITGEVRRRPSLVTKVGLPSDVMRAISQELTATPTLGFLFSTGDMRKGDIPKMLAERMPLSCDIIGARTSELQALVQSERRPRPAQAAADPTASPGRPSGTQLETCREPGRVAMQLGSFPDATAQSFHMSDDICERIAGADTEAAAQVLLREAGYPVGPEWKTIVLIASSTDALESVINAFQRGHPGTAILGGIAEDQLLIHSRGTTKIKTDGIAGLALQGDVPLTALVSRGCSALTKAFRSRGARVEGEAARDGPEPHILVPELIAEDGSTVQPLQIALQLRRGPVFVGWRCGCEGGFLLEPLSNHCFGRGGSLKLELPGSPSSPDVSDVEVCFYGLDPDACREDLRRLLGHVQTHCERNRDQMMGAVMFTCNGRGMRFFGGNHVDAKEFHTSFPSVTLAGLWAGGEIGPQALAEAAPEQATRTGRAALQGFTAVFGIFRAPLPASRSWLASYRDDEVPAAVGEAFGRLAREAKALADAAEAAGEPTVELRRRADALASAAASAG